MKAIIYRQHGPAAEVLNLTHAADPNPGPGEVVVRVAASGVNPHDVKKRSGWLGGAVPKEGIIPHSDGAGTIVAVGTGVNTDLVGLRVFFSWAGPERGAAAEYCVLSQNYVFPLPEHLSDAQGASLGIPAFTAWLAVLANGPVTGQTLLVHGGSGSVGRIIVELAAWNGATVIATAGSPERAALTRNKGADHVLDYRKDDVVKAVLDLTEQRGVDRIIDVDFAANMDINVRVIADHGRICSYSSTSNRTPTLPYYGFAAKGVSLNFIQASRMCGAQRAQAGHTLLALLNRKLLAPDVAFVLPLSKCAAAHTLVEEGKASANVVVSCSEEKTF